MPPLQALLALHGLWLLLAIPLTIWALRQWSAAKLYWLGSLLTFLALVALGFVITQDVVGWLPSVAEEDRRYLAQRVAYSLAIWTDVPVVQALLTGVIWLRIGRRRRSRVEEQSLLPLGKTADLPSTQEPAEGRTD
jgi:hypothetical protein